MTYGDVFSAGDGDNAGSYAQTAQMNLLDPSAPTIVISVEEARWDVHVRQDPHRDRLAIAVLEIGAERQPELMDFSRVPSWWSRGDILSKTARLLLLLDEGLVEASTTRLDLANLSAPTVAITAQEARWEVHVRQNPGEDGLAIVLVKIDADQQPRLWEFWRAPNWSTRFDLLSETVRHLLINEIL